MKKNIRLKKEDPNLGSDERGKVSLAGYLRGGGRGGLSFADSGGSEVHVGADVLD
jgi:hypothetical protein